MSINQCNPELHKITCHVKLTGFVMYVQPNLQTFYLEMRKIHYLATRVHTHVRSCCFLFWCPLSSLSPVALRDSIPILLIDGSSQVGDSPKLSNWSPFVLLLLIPVYLSLGTAVCLDLSHPSVGLLLLWEPGNYRVIKYLCLSNGGTLS